MTPQIENHLTASANMKKRHIMLNNFLGGLAWGVGSVIGATIIVAILIGILSQLNFLPGVSSITNQISNTQSARLRK